MNIAIIGCGYVGSAVARHWHSDSNLLITATTTTKERLSELKEITERVLITSGNNPASLLAAVENQQAILLSIAPTGKQQVDALGYKKTYLDTAENLIAVLKQTNTVKQLIYTSSCAVYGDANGEWVNEESPVYPVNKQGEILLETEQVLLQAAHQDLKVCILRLGGIYGPERDMKARFSRFAGTTMPGSGKNFTNWIHLDDIVAAIDFALNHQLQGIYNVVNNVHLKTDEFFDRLCEHYHLPKVEWDNSISDLRPNVRVLNEKIKSVGYKIIHSDTVI